MKNNTLYIFIGFILGILSGIFIPDLMNKLSFLGTIYINLLKFLISPILFTTVTLTIYKFTSKKYKFLLKTILLFIVLFISSYLITSLIVYIFNPANNFTFNKIIWEGEITSLKYDEIITNLFPNNIISIFLNNSIFSLIIFSISTGIALGNIKKSKEIVNLLESLKELFNKLLEFVMFLSPIGVFSLMATTISSNGISTLLVGLKYILVAYLSSIIVLLIVMILPVWLTQKINPITYIKKASKVWLVSLTTCSSLATLPYTIKCCEKEFKVSDKVTNLVVPLGCTIHMCGGAISFALLSLFTLSLYGIELTLSTYVLMMLSATIINMAAPGIPNGGVVLGATFLSLFGLPLDFIGFYSGIYKLLDMAYTTLNVTGDITSSILLNNQIK